jgi:molecular chaperone DnaK (HSP70)
LRNKKGKEKNEEEEEERRKERGKREQKEKTNFVGQVLHTTEKVVKICDTFINFTDSFKILNFLFYFLIIFFIIFILNIKL